MTREQINADTTKVTAPVGMTGLAVEPWTPGEVYAVAANWANAAAPIRIYGRNGWEYDDRGRQVADFVHSKREALECVVREAIIAGGDEPDDDDVAEIMDAAYLI